jgi:hypothetical protein
MITQAGHGYLHPGQFPTFALRQASRHALLTWALFGAMIGLILHERNGMGCAVSAMMDAAEEHDNGAFRSHL